MKFNYMLIVSIIGTNYLIGEFIRSFVLSNYSSGPALIFLGMIMMCSNIYQYIKNAISKKRG